MAIRSASAFSDARDSSALLTASCKPSLPCARHGMDTVSTNNNNDAKMQNPPPEILTDVFTAPLSLGAQIIERSYWQAPISAVRHSNRLRFRFTARRRSSEASDIHRIKRFGT